MVVRDAEAEAAAGGGAPALSVQGLSKRFGDRVAFQDVTFEVGHGEVFGFLGPNGAGKTTAVVGERQQGTLEPVLTTPIRREELLLGKALAALAPSVAIAYAVSAFFLACVGLLARPAVASALIRGPDLLAQLLFTPPLAAWSIWVGMAISSRASDFRVAQQLSLLAGLPAAVVAALIAFDVVHPTLALALGLAAALLLVDGLGWRVTSASFDREQLVAARRAGS